MSRNQPQQDIRTSAARLVLEDGSVYTGESFGYPGPAAGEVVFNTGMTGYPETLSDPSYHGEIVVLTYPLIGNYGIPEQQVESQLSQALESTRLQASGLVVADYSAEFHHWNARKSLQEWLIESEVPAITGIDTRALTRKLRERGTMLGRIEFDNEPGDFYDPNQDNLVAGVSIDKPIAYGDGDRRVLLIDCGAKHGIIHQMLARGMQVLRVPWDYDFSEEHYEGILLSNGPGNPKMCRRTIHHIRNCLNRDIPIWGICLGHQLLALAAGANTYKLKYGHRSQNQPVLEVGSNRCLITSQNHGFAVDTTTLPDEWLPWFENLNDGTNEGIKHRHKPFMSVQFHPEHSPGPVDAEFLFDQFAAMLNQAVTN